MQEAKYTTFFTAYRSALSCAMDEMMLEDTGNSKKLTWMLGDDSKDYVTMDS